MSKIRVYELAKKLDMSSKELISKLEELSIEVNSHMSSLEEEEVNIIEELFAKPEETPKKEEEKKPEEPKKTNKKAKKKKLSKKEQKKQRHQETQQKKEKTEDKSEGKNEVDDIIELEEKIIVKDLAEKLDKNPNEIIGKLVQLGIMAAINQEIDFETAELIAEEYGIEVSLKESEEEKVEDPEELLDFEIEEDDPKDLEFRSPVISVMGHVDHGKTTLLDAIRKTKHVDTEAGGITQHIGASEIAINDQKIVFLDTPGHEAFTSMRARGAKATDIAILVVAADDGVMPQTIEAINHARAAEIPMIVAINKIDKPGANADRVKQELTEHNVVIEDWGGDVIAVEVSAIEGSGIDQLLETILLVAEMEELKANPNRKALGIVVEANLDKGRGAVATVLVKNGTLNIGDNVVVGLASGKVRAMINDSGKRLKKAGPATAVEITGLSEVPKAGDKLIVVDDEKMARNIAAKRQSKVKLDKVKSDKRVSLEDLYDRMKEGELKELNIIVKADVQGSVEAVKQSLSKLTNEEVVIKPIHGGVGAITETDVMLASASNAIIIGFNVRPTSSATAIAKKEEVDLRTYRIIYQAIEDIENAMEGMLDPEFKEVDLGKVEVRATFKVPNAGMIAGCYVLEGKITRNAKIRLVRDGIVVHEGEIDSLKRFKDDAKEVVKGFECGVGIENFNDVKEGDIIEAYEIQEVERKLKK
ncbi:translation initiation factor IF-2 [Isachenkonia alkalipeptolytica]|uniref:Translation initiation factor IF-2 n=1 Tax=Isachenkonia alkalipeptolytica TaxID=2565777 RepID=A0AA44BD65_9CLOT|nr:translation initiation factor IF-2 [Isachenkonia alkalipeptolytica]NBG87612.1 translation initiation factor IF-2 [Isachenkonia alkalipeptolytica]